MISEMPKHFGHSYDDVCERKPIINPAVCLSTGILGSEFQSNQGVGSMGDKKSQGRRIIDWTKRRIMTMLQSDQRCLYFTQRLSWLTIHPFKFSMVTPWSLSHMSLTTCSIHAPKAPHFSSSSSSFWHLEKQTISAQQESGCWSQHHTQQLYWMLTWQFRIKWWASSATIQEWNGQAAIKRVLPITTWKMSHPNSNMLYVGSTAISWASGGLYYLWGGVCLLACATGIEECIRLHLEKIVVTH